MDRWPSFAVMVACAACRLAVAGCPPVPANPNCGFQADTPPTNCAAGMPGVEFWDCRLNCILTHIDRAVPQPGQGRWRLLRGEFEPEGSTYAWQSHGGYYIYYKVLDASGNPITGQWVETTNPNRPDTIFYQATDAGSQYWARQPMEGQTATFTNCVCATSQIWPYTGRVYEASSPAGYVGPSDKVHGMGMTNPPYGTYCNAHVNYRLTFRWTPPTAVVISLSPTTVTHTVIRGQSVPADTLTLLNEGGSIMHFTVTDDASWISVTPASGTLNPQASTPVTVAYSTATLSPGVYNAAVTFTDPNAIPPQAVVPVQLIVKSEYRGDFDGDNDVDQMDFGHIQACITGAAVAQGDPGCFDARLDEDFDVDEADVALFISCLSGSGTSPGANCRN